jgi:hypothetical protein
MRSMPYYKKFYQYWWLMHLKNVLNSTTGTGMVERGELCLFQVQRIKHPSWSMVMSKNELILFFKPFCTRQRLYGKETWSIILVSAKDCGLPVIQREDTSTAAAMIADVNRTRTQQCIISKYIWYAFGSEVIAPELKQVELGPHHRHPLAFYSSSTHKTEDIDYWYFNLTEVYLSEVNFFMESLHGDLGELRPFENMKGDLGWTILAGEVWQRVI